MIDIQGRPKETSRMKETLEAYPLNQSSKIFKHCCLKTCTRDRDNFKQFRHYDYVIVKIIRKF